ncbi:hypothetical protein A8B82_11745 [Sulfitobacter sp. EhC04]|uniref:hypothetical protein n=1 Tax=Sulfitobacter sp. EhC04 TaxID=1849168 RepID=UPI0007F47707|nr:hypothetical protein [Sulfitobacter sp. EhC04]OAN77875.1 hypothetical protein A8B82_11745 [Sulfitobacter sp. EhC04]
MKTFKSSMFFSAVLSLLGPVAANAEVLSTTNPTIRSFLCVGPGCADNETASGDELRLKGNNVHMHFDDDSTIAGLPNNDWKISINDTYDGGEDYFSIVDATNGKVPFRVDADAPTNALRVTSSGNLGLGTAIPLQDIHIIDTAEPAIRFEKTGGSAYSWDVRANQFGFYLFDLETFRIPFEVRANAPDGALYVESDGSVGIGTRDPDERLHVRSNAPNSDAFALFEAAGSGSDAAFRLKQNGVTPTTWEFRNQQDSGRLNVGLAGGNTPFKIDNAANNNLLRLGRNGRPDEVVVTGTLVVNNTDMNVPDYVFAEGYALRPLAEVQAFIDENAHLPEVPSEADIKANGVDLTAMQMTLLKKVEELTLYTLALEEARAEQAQEIAELRRLVTANPD